MRILATGLSVFVIWAFFSTWLYVDVLRHAAKKPVTAMAAPQPANAAADSMAKLYAMMPKDLMVSFDFDKYKVRPDPQFEAGLAEFKNWLARYPESVITVTGYTDLVGNTEYNRELGLERARAVEKYLETRGFPASRMEISSRGEEDPVAGYITPGERAKNRRTVISIKK